MHGHMNVKRKRSWNFHKDKIRTRVLIFTTLFYFHKKDAYSSNILISTNHTTQFRNSKFHNVYLKPKSKIPYLVA